MAIATYGEPGATDPLREFLAEFGKEATAAPRICDDDLLTEGECAEQFGVVVTTLRRWARQRSGPPRTLIGRRILYRRETLARWLLDQEERREAPAAPRRGRPRKVAR